MDSCNVSLVDLTLNLEKETSLEEIISKLDIASKTSLKGVLAVEYDELVSCDFQGNSHSCVIDAKGCMELNPKVRLRRWKLVVREQRLTKPFSSLRFLRGMIMSGRILRDY
jgi:glyceraldehyde-3-phosphate dehydrogenase/erythrose-4-phosphate dehydrogenase